MAKLAEVKRTLKEDWTVLPFTGLTLLGFATAIIDFAFFQNFTFQVFAIAGLFLFSIGGAMRIKARLELNRKAGFGGYFRTWRVKILKDHQLVTDGLYKHIRNPIYLAEILRNLGVVLVFSSAYGSLLILLASIFLLFRINLEEKILTAEFGEEYEEYKRNTKRLIPHIY
ncbi:isoprenylcysteine carboxylmethyltransferase family protein [Candidatus Bathyarchaeota archaeon]|nr:isoprenylcysteine carboxylmethyltransferase family protein [Candidatus Bathyarchaeota archaeon]